MATSPGRKRNEAARDDNEQHLNQLYRERGALPVSKPKQYDFTKDPIVPLGDERFAPREESVHARHRREHQPPGGDSISSVPFKNLKSERE